VIAEGSRQRIKLAPARFESDEARLSVWQAHAARNVLVGEALDPPRKSHVLSNVRRRLPAVYRLL